MLVTAGVPIFLISLLFLAPGANWNISFLIMFIPSLALASVYVLFGISMPRSGGDYVFVSRGLHPVLGFLNSFALFFGFVFSLGIYIYFMVQYLAYAIATWGYLYNSSILTNLASMILSQSGLLISSIIFIIFYILLVTLTTTKAVFRLVVWVGIISLAATVIFFIITITITPATFSAAFNKAAGSGTYLSVINTAVSNGLSYQGGSWSAVVLGLPIAWYAFSWYTLPTNWSGEMREIKKTLPIGVIGGLVMILVYYLAFYNTSFLAFGEKFLTAWSYNYAYGYHLPFSFIGTYTPFFVSIVYPSPIIPFIGLLVFWIPLVFITPVTILGATRYLFAWSFDRMAPTIFSRVSPRTKVPVISTVTVGLLIMLGLFAYVYIPSAAIIDIIPIFDFGYIIPALTAILLPLVKKDLYKNAFVFKRKFLGVPMISWLGAIALAGIIYGIIGLWNSYLMPINFTTEIMLIGIYVTAVIIFVAMYFIDKKKGVNPLYAFKEVPPE